MKSFSVLVPTDFSEASARAVDSALELRNKHPDLRITLLHVMEPLPMPIDATVMIPTEPPERREQWEKELEELAVKLREKTGVPIDTLFEIGPAWPTICDVAERLQCDFIVQATHGRTGLARLFMGSVAEQVVRHAKCPVMVIHSYKKDE